MQRRGGATSGLREDTETAGNLICVGVHGILLIQTGWVVGVFVDAAGRCLSERENYTFRGTENLPGDSKGFSTTRPVIGRESLPSLYQVIREESQKKKKQ
jgi:hypothetical protein